MIVEFPVEDSVRKRRSVRNYSDRRIEPEKIREIKRFAETLDNPFEKEVLFHFFEVEAFKNQLEDASGNPRKIGTYGVIKGAGQFIGASIKREPLALESLGYEMETLLLYLTSLGLGSCWLGGTFDRKGFVEAMDIGAGRILPAISPFGYNAGKMHVKENLMRKLIGAEKRKPWELLFFHNNFDTPLTKQFADDLAHPLEMLRLGPSASNKQPWRVLYKDGAMHFYEDRSAGYSAAFSFDIQRIDMGIAAGHFDLSANERGIFGQFEVDPGLAKESDLKLPERYEYVFSWRRK